MCTEEITYKSMINGVSLPTLEEISILELAIQALENEEIKEIFCQHFSGYNALEYFSNETIFKLTSLCKKSLQISSVFEAKVVSGFQWVREQYYDWIWLAVQTLPQLVREFPKKLDYIIHIMNSARWSMGVIDKQKSIHQVLLLSNVRSVSILIEMFKVASRFCLENDLKIFWEKLSDSGKNKLELECCNKKDAFALYWICKMRGDLSQFIGRIHEHLMETEHEAVLNSTDPNVYALVLHTFEGDILGMKYFYKLVNINIEHMVFITKIFLGCLNSVNATEINTNYSEGDLIFEKWDRLLFLLKEIQDEDILKEVFHEFFRVFLLLSVQSGPWHKCFLPLLKIFVDFVDQELIYDLVTMLLGDVKVKKADICEVKMLWKEVPSSLKKLFCLFISNQQEERAVGDLWCNLSVEVLNMFLKDEELRNILTPHENHGILECICSGQYDLIEFWLQKCLVSEEAIISFINNFALTKSVAVVENLKNYPLNLVNKFFDWAFKYEDLMSTDEVFKVKDEAMNENIVTMFANGLDQKEWVDLEKLMDWMVRKRNLEYENELVIWKQKAIEKLMCEADECIFSIDFATSLSAFLSHGVSDPGKIKVMMSNANLKEGKICSEHLLGDFPILVNFLTFLKHFGKNIVITKEKTFYFLFNSLHDVHFESATFWENIRKFLCYNFESDEDIETEVEEIKKTIIEKHGLESILTLCLRIEFDFGLNNILKFLFEGKMEDEEWLKMLFDLKLKVIEQLKSSISIMTTVGRKEDELYVKTLCSFDSSVEKRDQIWGRKDFYDMIILFVNWGKENEKIKKDNWEVKKCFIERLKIYLRAEIIPELILDWNFVCSFFEGDENMTDFEKILWDLKEFLVVKVLSEDDHVLTCKLLENLEGFSSFLTWNNYNETNIQELTAKILKEKGMSCCSFWIQNRKVNLMMDFLKWCIRGNSNYDLKSMLLKLEEDLLKVQNNKNTEM